MEIGRLLIMAGIMLFVLGVLTQSMGFFPLGSLPGDINIKRENFSVHIPLVTSLVLSIVISFLFWLMTK